MLLIAVFLTLLPAALGQAAHPPLPQDAQLRRVLEISADRADSHSAAYLRAQQKLNEITGNGRLAQPQAKTTVLTTEEIDAYLAEGGVALPNGVQRVHFSSVPGVVTTTARIDFDRLPASRRINNPLMAALFTGVHEVSVETQASGSGGTGLVSVARVAIDGVNVPRMAMQFLVDYYLRPKYGPSIGLDSRFALPAHIDTVRVGNNEVALTQR
jgi:hypothetical protein